MDKLLVTGPSKLSGSVKISRAKNAYLPILAGVLINPKKIHLKNLPNLKDIRTISTLLEMLGVKITKNDSITTFDASNVASLEATYDLVKTMRASILVLGPLLARFKSAKVSLPGGCAIGTRPIDLHLENLEKLGAKISIQGGYVQAETSGLVGDRLVLKFPSVGATENIMMAACLAKGETVIENAALEPEIEDLANYLIKMGVKIEGAGTSIITITGVENPDDLNEIEYEAIGDRIEASTYLMAALATNSEIRVTDINPKHMDAIILTLKGMGAKIEVGDDYIHVRPSVLVGAKVETSPYPGFPTDAQAQLMALSSCLDNATLITENIFENRFMHVPELNRMGASIWLKGKHAFIEGQTQLTGAPVMCTDLRASAALVIAALAAKGVTEIQRVYHLDRGYENLEQKLKDLGAKLERVSG